MQMRKLELIAALYKSILKINLKRSIAQSNVGEVWG